MERSSNRLESRHPQDEVDDVWHEDSKKHAKKSRCSVHDYKNNINISGGLIGESSTTLPLDAFVGVMEFLHPRVREYDTFHFCIVIN